MDKNSLPAEWKIEKLSIYVDTLESGSRPRGGVSKYTSGVPSISAEQILPDGNFYWDKTKYVPEPFYNSSTRGKIQKGDILIVKDGATTGKVAYIDKGFPHPKAMVNEHTFILRLKKNISTQWVYLFLRSHYLADFREKARQRGVIGGLTQGFLDELEIPVPPLPEQRRIVARIEQLTSRLKKAAELQKQAVDEAEQCLPSLVSNFFTDGIKSGWCMQPLNKVVTIKYGKGLAKKKRERGDVPVYGSNGVVGYHNEAITKAQTIIIGRKGSVGEINFSEESCWPIDTAFYIDSFPNELNPYWLYLYLRIAKLPSLVQDGPKPGIRRDSIYETEVPMAPVKEQKKFVDYFQSLRNKSNQLKRLQAETAAELEKFMPALLAKAFRGEL